MIPGFQGQKSDASLLARGFLTLDPAKHRKVAIFRRKMSEIACIWLFAVFNIRLWFRGQWWKILLQRYEYPLPD